MVVSYTVQGGWVMVYVDRRLVRLWPAAVVLRAIADDAIALERNDERRKSP